MNTANAGGAAAQGGAGAASGGRTANVPGRAGGAGGVAATSSGAGASAAVAGANAAVAGASANAAGGAPGAAGQGGVNAGASGAVASGGTGAGTGADAGSGGQVAGSSAAGSGEPAAGASAAGTAAAGSGSSVMCTPPAPGTMGRNPLFSDTFTADPGPMVHDCTFYIYCGHDEGTTGFNIREWYVLSSTDMVTWDKQVVLDLQAFSWADVNAWAGQAVAKDGKFYWYVPVNERGGGMTIAVAVGDSPTGPFEDAIGKPLINDAFEMSNVGFRTPSDTPFTIDPTVFVDDDGQAYLHYGGFGRMMVAKLGSDMISIEGKLEEVTPRGFFEAPFLTKHDGVYYEIYAAGTNPASIDYATSASPLGPWEYGGRILDPLPFPPGDDAATSHPGVAELAGQWYLVYHLSNGPMGGGTYRRQVALEKLTWNPDGSIAKIEPSSGLRF
ncbi:MAG: family 43 glycosylhydrolase [Polyangiales bacterium]